VEGLGAADYTDNMAYSPLLAIEYVPYFAEIKVAAKAQSITLSELP
jgi:hypothetical protein